MSVHYLALSVRHFHHLVPSIYHQIISCLSYHNLTIPPRHLSIYFSQTPSHQPPSHLGLNISLSRHRTISQYRQYLHQAKSSPILTRHPHTRQQKHCEAEQPLVFLGDRPCRTSTSRAFCAFDKPRCLCLYHDPES